MGAVLRVIITLIAGVAVPLIILLALMLAGEPPAIIAAWERGEVEVTAHESVTRDTGYGLVERIEVRAVDPDGETRLLRIADDPSGAGAARLFPVGSTLTARLSPGGNLAWPNGETGLFTFAAFTAAPLILFVVLGINFRPVISLLAGLLPSLRPRTELMRSALRKGVTLMSFITIPLFVMGLFWSLGDAPALRWFAPIIEARISAVSVEPAPRNLEWIASIALEADGLAFPELNHTRPAFGDVASAEDYLARYTPGETLTVRLYRHRAYSLDLRAFDFAVLAATLACLFVMLTGLLAILRSLFTPVR